MYVNLLYMQNRRPKQLQLMVVIFSFRSFESNCRPIMFTNSSEHQPQIGSPEMSRVNSARRLGANMKERRGGVS